ncbi:MAG: hypothetical protein WD969_16305 [Paracoccaceae bacterium]
MNRREGALLAALTAAASALRLRWLYGQNRIAELAGDAPEFRTPNAAVHVGADGGGLGYFAHGGERPAITRIMARRCWRWRARSPAPGAMTRMITQKAFANGLAMAARGRPIAAPTVL